MSAVDAARGTPGVVAVSMSWGFNESPDQTANDAHFTTPPGHAGVTFLAASGDSGSWAGAEWPAASPNVVGVGGTSLTLDASGNYQSEAAWSGGGGGLSGVEAEPTFQQSYQATGARSSPDVAFDADPGSGVRVFTTAPSTGQGSWQTVGGTSLGAPAWAAIIAVVDQGRALDGKSSLDGPSQTLPSLYALPSADFHNVPDTTSLGGSIGSIDLPPLPIFPIFFDGFPISLLGGSSGTSSSVNTVTGLGSPNGVSLVNDLVASTTTMAPGSVASGGGGGSSQTPQPVASAPVPTPSSHHHHHGSHKAHPIRHPQVRHASRVNVRAAAEAKRTGS
jgi:hypothetical protein